MRIVLSALLVVIVIAACVHLLHVAPTTRTPDQQARAVAIIEVECSYSSPFGGENVPDMFGRSSAATGVVISERHILTAAHAVACPVIPTVHATFSDGRRFRVMVTDEDDDLDVARLESSSLENFNLGVAPPALASLPFGQGTGWCAAGVMGLRSCGLSWGDGRFSGSTVPGWSGAGVYDASGALVGLVITRAIDGTYTRVAPVDAHWLSGT